MKIVRHGLLRQMAIYDSRLLYRRLQLSSIESVYQAIECVQYGNAIRDDRQRLSWQDNYEASLHEACG